MKKYSYSLTISLTLLVLLLGSMFYSQNANASALSSNDDAIAESIQSRALPTTLTPQQVNQLLANGRTGDKGLSLQESIIERPGTPNGWSTDDIVGVFGNTKAEYQKVWEPWITRAATHSVALSEDKQFLAVGTGYLSDNEIHVYRWHPEKREYVLVSQVGDGIIGGDVVELGFADVDNNGFIDIAAASTDGYVYLFEQAHVYDPYGSSENRFDLVWQSERMLKAASVIVYDADLDGFTDVIAGGWDGRIRVYEYRERSPYPFSKEHTKYLKEVFVSDYLGSPVQQVRGGDFDGDYLPEILVGLRDGTLLIYENAGETIDTPSGPFPITYDNFYKQIWSNNETIWRPILDIQVDDIDLDKKQEAAIVALGQDVYLLDTDNNDKYVIDKITRSPQQWEQSGVYPIDYYVDLLMNASNIYFNGNLSAAEPLDWKDGGNKVSPYTSGMVNRSDSYYSLLRASAGKVWALMDWGSYEELVSSGNDEADIVIHLNSPWNGNPSSINMTLSMNYEKWAYLSPDNIWLSPDKMKIFIDIDPVTSLLKWQFVRYMNMTIENAPDMEIVYWEAARINLRLGDARSVMFSRIIDDTGTSRKVLTVASSDGKLLSFYYIPASDREPWQSRMKMVLNSYADQLFTIDTGGAWQMAPNPLYRPVPNWRDPEIPSFTLQSLFGYSSVQQVTVGPSLHPYFYLLGDKSPNDLYFVVDKNNVTFLPDPSGPSTALSSISGMASNIFEEINSNYKDFTEIRIAVMDILYMPWEEVYPMPEILVSYYLQPNDTGFVGDVVGTAGSGIDVYVLSDWMGNSSLIKYRKPYFGFYDPSGRPFIDLSGTLQGMAKGLREPLELGTGDFDGDGVIDLVVSDGKRVELFRQDRGDRFYNGSLTLVPGFFDEINDYLSKVNREIENLQGFDYDNDGDADLVVSYKRKYGFSFFENIGNRFDPIWREKRSFVHNRAPDSSFTNYNFELAVIWSTPDSFDSEQPTYQLYAVNDSTEIAIFQPSYSGQQSWVLATYPEVKIILTNFYNNPTSRNWGFEYFEAWSNTLLTQNWTRALDTGILDGDDAREVVIADYDNNLYVFEHLTNNTYKRAYRSPDLQRIEPTNVTPYASDVLIGLDAPINRSVYENARFVVADVDLDSDGLREIIVATDTQIFRIEATGYNDEFQVVGQISLPSFDPLAKLYSEYASMNLDLGITALDAFNDMNSNEYGEIVVGFGMYLLVFELTDTGDFKEIMGYDVTLSNMELSVNYLPTAVSGGNPFEMPFGTITAVLVEDLNRDGYPEIILGGKTNLEIGGYPGFLRILSSGENKYGYPDIAWTEIWNETMIPGFMDRNYVTSLALDDQNYDGKLDLIVGHKYGFDIINVENIFNLQRVKSVSGSPGYPIESYTPVLNNPRNNGTFFDMYSSSITQDDSGYYYVAYSEKFTNSIDPVNYDNRKHIFLARSVSPNSTTAWTTPTIFSQDTAGITYFNDAEIMPSITFGNGLFAMTWVTHSQSGSSVNGTYLWFTWTDDFANWAKYPVLRLFYTTATTYNPLFITTPQVAPGPISDTGKPTFLVATAINSYPVIFTFAIEVDPIAGTSALIGPNNGIGFLYPFISGTQFSNYAVHSIGLTVAEDASPGWFDVVVSMKYYGNETTSYDLWHARMKHPAYFNVSKTIALANWTRITDNYVDELYPSIARIGSKKEGLIVTYMQKSTGIRDYEFKSITGVAANNTWPYRWSEPSEIPNLPFEFHEMRRYQWQNSKAVFDGRLFNEAFSNQFYVSKAKYNLFEAPDLRIGRPALAPYKNGYALAYPLSFRDPFRPVYPITVNLGDYTLRFVVYNIISDLFVLANPEDSFLYTDVSDTVDIAVGDTDRDGRREVLVGYGKTAELFELQKWQASGNIQYSSEWLDTSLQNNLSRLETTAVAIFDANGNGFEEMFVASRSGDVRAFEIKDTTMGVSYGSAFRFEDDATVSTDVNWFDIMASSWGNGTSLVSVIGTQSSDPGQKVIRVYYAANSTNLGNYAEIVETLANSPIYVFNLVTNATSRKAIIAAVFSDGTNMEVRTYSLEGSTLSPVSSQSSTFVPVMSTISGGVRVFEPLYSDVTGDGLEDLVIAAQGAGFIVNATGAISVVGALLNFQLSQGFDLGDVNGDGVDEIITTYANNTVTARTANGTIVQQWTLPTDIIAPAWNGVATLDIDNDGREDYVLGRADDGLVVAISSSDGSQLWNMTLGTSGYLYFRAVDDGSNKEIYIVNGFGDFIAAAITPQGLIRWMYDTTNSFKYPHDVVFDKATGEFLVILSTATFGSDGQELLLVLDQDGVVKSISYAMTSPSGDVDEVTPFEGISGLGIKKGASKITKFDAALPVTWFRPNTVAPRLSELTLRTRADYEPLIEDLDFDGYDEFFFYSIEEDKILLTAFDGASFETIYTLDLTNFDLVTSPVVYKDSLNDVAYLVLANKTHIMFVTLSGYVKEVISFYDDYDTYKLTITNLIVSDLLGDGVSELYVELSVRSPYSAFVLKKLYVFGDGDIEKPLQEFTFSGYTADVFAYRSNENYFGFILHYYIPNFNTFPPLLTFSTMALVYEWAPGTGLVSLVNYTSVGYQAFFENLEFQPKIEPGTGDQIYLIDRQGILRVDAVVSDASPELSILATLPTQIVYDPQVGDYQNRTYRYSDFREFTAYNYVPSISVESYLFIGIRDGLYVVIDTSKGFGVVSNTYNDNYVLILPRDPKSQTMYVGVGDALLTKSIDGSTTSPFGYKAQGFITRGGYWSPGSNDVWYKTLHGDIVFAGDSLPTETYFVSELATQNVLVFNSQTAEFGDAKGATLFSKLGGSQDLSFALDFVSETYPSGESIADKTPSGPQERTRLGISVLSLVPVLMLSNKSKFSVKQVRKKLSIFEKPK